MCFAVSEGVFPGRAYRDHFNRRSHAHDVEGLVLPTFQVLPSPSKWAGGSMTGLLKELFAEIQDSGGCRSIDYSALCKYRAQKWS